MSDLSVEFYVSVISALVIMVAAVVTFIARFWPIMKRIGHLIDDVQGEKDRPGVPGRPGVMERLFHVEEGHTKILDKLECMDVRHAEFSKESAEDRLKIWQNMEKRYRVGNDEN